MKLWLIAITCLSMGCAAQAGQRTGTRGTLITPSNQTVNASWSEAERAAPVAMRNLRRSPSASSHLLRIAGERATHVHTQSDLTLFLIAGEVELTVEGKTLTMKQGDVMELPRETGYGVRDLSSEPSVAYLVFTPPLAADDDKALADSERVSAWRWNLWVQ